MALTHAPTEHDARSEAIPGIHFVQKRGVFPHNHTAGHNGNLILQGTGLRIYKHDGAFTLEVQCGGVALYQRVSLAAVGVLRRAERVER